MYPTCCVGERAAGPSGSLWILGYWANMTPSMADEAAPSPVDHLAVVQGMSARIRAGEPVDPQRIERTLEAGFGALIGLEAELSRALRASRDGGGPAQSGDELIVRIGELRDALTELRTLAVAPGESRIGYGFVLPSSYHAHASRN